MTRTSELRSVAEDALLEKITGCFGLTGLPGSGKGKVAQILEVSACQKLLVPLVHSHSDELGVFLRKLEAPITRSTKTKLANQLRHHFGTDAVAKLVWSHLMADLEQLGDQPALVVVDAIRSPGEVEFFSQAIGRRFVLIAVEASPEVIKFRLRQRNREEQEATATSDADFEEMLRSEVGQNRPGYAVNVGDCMAMADHTVMNNDSLESLERQVSLLAEAYLPAGMFSNSPEPSRQ